MQNRPVETNRQKLSEIFWPAVVLILLLVYSYARFFVLPYTGFQMNTTTGDVLEVYVEQTEQPRLEIGDKIESINGVQFEDYLDNLDVSLYEGIRAGDAITIEAEDVTGTKAVPWIVPGFVLDEFSARFFNTWLLSYLFWLAGAATLLLVRPRDQRRSLLAAFYFITAIWLMAGANSPYALWFSQYVFRAAIWIAMPIYLHLHGVFPRLLAGRTSRWWLLLYGFCGVLAVAQLFGLLPSWLYFVPFLLGILGSAAILVLRAIFDKPYRRELTFMLFSFLIAFAPALALAGLSLGIGVPIQFAGALISILAFPGAYFYVVYRSQLGGAEFRANRLISFYLFLVVLVTLFLALSPLFSAYFTSLAGAGAIILGTGIVTALLSVFGFSRFQAFVERRFLGIARPTADLLPAFAGRLSTSFTVENLVDILEKEVLPSLLVRQSTLVKVAAGRATRKTIYLQGLKSASLPSAKELQEYLQAGMESKTGSFAIVKDTALRLAVPVRVGKDPVALWLLGRKDPDDHYSYAEQSLLRSLADQMAIALANIAQAQSLRLLYQIDIERQEDERARLALELHDDILNEVNSLLLDAERKLQSEALKEKHHALDDRIRRLIQGLRPPMLNYGLYQAFSDMAAQLEPETKGVTLSLALPASEERYDRKVEEHVYRVVQQAVENALRHGKAEYISINGSLKPGEIQILVEDDGIGFKIESADLAQLLEAKHFGMAGMNERAALIGAKLRITSTPRRGTQVQLH